MSYTVLTPSEDNATKWPDIIARPVRLAGRKSALLRVDQGHPFFFDHPLDHVPGMLLVAGLLDLSCGDAGRRLSAAHRLSFSVRFSKICELDREVTLFARQEHKDPAGRSFAGTVWAAQDGDEVCSGTIDFARDDKDIPRPSTSCGGSDGTGITPILPHLIHRASSHNVVIGELEACSDQYEAPLAAPPPEHFLRRRHEAEYGIEEILEAGRQFITAACHIAHQRPLGTQLLWAKLRVNLPTGISRSLPLALRWRMQPPRGNWSIFSLELVVRGSGRRLGSLYYSIKCLTPAAYRASRATSGLTL